ncbi:helicase domain protein [Nitzschia inconspicua]|uniref:Helicase domain protein n=1 Tax=Nitzschia inconspicua TaxID=303405 RepID=A0A9K3PEC1_9STRA|nr:helicase domain protein [Nitzschia inconspicua]
MIMKSLYTIDHEGHAPPAKRARINDEEGVALATDSSCITNVQQGCRQFVGNRRSSLAHFMDPGASPVKLDIVIDKGIFDRNPLVSPIVTDDRGEQTRFKQHHNQHQHLTPSLFEFNGPRVNLPPKELWQADVANRSILFSTDAIIHETREINDLIDQEPSIENFSNSTNFDSSSDADARFRTHQAEGWMEKFEQLLLYKEKNGDCLVPNQYPENPSLAEWVKRQRYQYKLRQNGQHSSMSDERIHALTSLGFCWNAHDACWAEKYSELIQYKRWHGHTNVPSSCVLNPKLAVWVKRQRRQYKFLMEGKASTLTPYRTQKLAELGFSWSGRTSK